MTEAVYRTGQAAKEWGVSSYDVRRLCEAGLIDAEFSAGKQWRIPASEVARVKREGVPPIPTTAEPEHGNPQAAARNTNGHRSEQLAEEDPEVVESAAGVKIMENTVRRRKLD